MNTRLGVNRLPALMLALAALFHVQWAVACGHQGRAGESHGAACCADQQHPARTAHCPDQLTGADCAAPFMKSATAFRVADRDAGLDRPPATPAIALFSRVDAGLRASHAHPPPAPTSAAPLGQTLYLTSGRLRL